MSAFKSISSLFLDIAAPGVAFSVLALTIGAFFILLMLIIVIESTALQWLAWDTFRRCLRAATWMNLASLVVGFFFLVMIPQFGWFGLVVALALSTGIEGLVLLHLKPGQRRQNWRAAIVANLASYLLLLFPIYYFSVQNI
jgi:hypothetical protein